MESDPPWAVDPVEVDTLGISLSRVDWIGGGMDCWY